MRVRILLSALLVMSSSAHTEETIETMGLGLQSCAKFAKAFQTNPEPTEAMYFSWAVGFMSGMNLAAAANKINLRTLGAMSFEVKAANAA
jgi:hypothetical protein